MISSFLFSLDADIWHLDVILQHFDSIIVSFFFFGFSSLQMLVDIFCTHFDAFYYLKYLGHSFRTSFYLLSLKFIAKSVKKVKKSK